MRKIQSHTSKNTMTKDETVQYLLEIIAQLKKENEELRATIEELKARLNENSQNSNFPPSHDLYPPVNKDRSLRNKTGRKVGGQKNHKGNTRELSDNPDEVHVLHVDTCTCGHDLHDVIPFKDRERRQIIEIPFVPCHITEYRGEVKRCPVCGKLIRSTFPENIPYRINYGENLKAYVIYLKDEFPGSYDKIVKLLKNFHHLTISPATLCGFVHAAGDSLIQFGESVKNSLIQSSVVNFDETGCRICGKKNWVHVACTPSLTYLYPHPKRGGIAMNEMGILPNFKGISVHDFWKPYNQFPGDDAFCHAHLIRELRGVYQNYQGNMWAKDLEMLFLEGYEHIKSGKLPSLAYITHFSREYDFLVGIGLKCNPPPETYDKRGRRKNSKPRNLLIRLLKFKEGILSFLENPEIPFTNNQAERDLRPVKIQQKISGTFRSEHGASSHFRIAGFIQTLKKNSKNICDGLRLLTSGENLSLSTILRG